MRVLLADDDPVSLRLLAVQTRAIGCTSVLVTTGVDALAALSAPDASFDAVVVDWAMPGLDGLALCERTRGLGIAARLVIVTALDLHEREGQARAAGADAVLSKPWRRDELARALGLGRGAAR